MNRQYQREEIQRMLQRWQQLRQQFGDRAVNVPEFAHLSKVLKAIQQQQQQQQQQNKPNSGANQYMQQAQQTGTPMGNTNVPMNSANMAPRPQQGNGSAQTMNGANARYMGNNMMNMASPVSQSSQQQSPVMNNMPPQTQQQLQQQQQRQRFAAAPPGTNVGTPMSTSQHSTPQMQQNPVMGNRNHMQQGGMQLNKTTNQNQQASAGQQPFPVPGATAAQSAFSAQQFQLLKSQYQALKYLLKAPAPGSPPIPQNLVEIVCSDRLAFAQNSYLPAANVPSDSPVAGAENDVRLARNLGMAANVRNPSIPQQEHQLSGMPPTNHSAMLGNAPTANQMSPHLMNPQAAQLQQQAQVQANLRQAAPQELLLSQAAAQAAAPTSAGLADSNPVVGAAPHLQASQLQRQSVHTTASPLTSFEPYDQKSNASTPAIAPTTSLQQQESQLKNVQQSAFVTLSPKPPVYIDDLDVPKKDKDNVVVPILKPEIQVDAFEVPQLIDTKDIPFKSLYSLQSKVLFPALMPTSFDPDSIAANREALILLLIDAELTRLSMKLESADEDQKAAIEAEIYKLELLPFQKELRGKILSHVWFSKSLLPNSHPNVLAKCSHLNSENAQMTQNMYKRQLYSLAQAQNRKLRVTLNEIIAHQSKKRDRLFAKRDKRAKICSKIDSFHSQIAREEQKKLERMAKQRLQALKLNDEEAYLKLLDHTKDTRITHLLKQTNQFLDTLAQAVQAQQRDSGKVDEPINDEKREKIDYYNVAHRIKEDVTKQPSILVGGTLKEYQLKGLQWMVSLYNNRLNGILADEMGLGKTIQTISLITYIVEVKKINGPFLVIVPLSTLTNWNLEFEKWAPSVKKITYKGTPNQRKSLQFEVRKGDFQILLTTFEYIIKDKSVLAKVKWIHMIIDEGHRMKNANSKLSETLTHHYHSDYRLILTGTPLQNNLPELWALLNFVLPKIFNSVKSFDEWFNTPFANTGGQDKIELSEEETLLVIRRLHKVLRPFLLRRLKKDVEKDLPNKVEKVVKCRMSSLQSKLYQQMLKYNVLFSSNPDGDGKPIAIKNTNNQIMQLRKICNHPFVYEEVENMINPTADTNDEIWRVAGKFELLDRILPKLKATGHRVLIFFQMTLIMNIMEDFLRLRDLKYMRLDGATKADDRTGLLKLFNEENSDYFCFLLSTRAGGLGLNLQTADTVIIFDSDWNPHQDLQAQDRAHRIGQKNEVRIIRLITEDSVEEMILERAHAKLEIDGKVIQAGKFDNKSTTEEQEALLRALFVKEEERKAKTSAMDGDDELDDDELNQILSRDDTELVVFRQLDEARNLETKQASYPTRLFSEQELPDFYKTNFDIYFDKDIVNADDYGRGARERKTALYDDNLTEEQWLKQIDGVLSSDDEMSTKGKRSRGRSKIKKNEEESGSENGFGRKRRLSNDDMSDFESSSRQGRSSTPLSIIKRRAMAKRGKRSKASFLSRTSLANDPLLDDARDNLQQQLEEIYETILNYTDENGRRLSDLFMVRPSKKLYPDYFVLIKHPMALDTIKKRITSNAYMEVKDMLEDIHLMFSNARVYNEEGSIVYEDANTLESLGYQKFAEIAKAANMSNEDIEKYLDMQEVNEVLGLKPFVPSAEVKRSAAANDNIEPQADDQLADSVDHGLMNDFFPFDDDDTRDPLL